MAPLAGKTRRQNGNMSEHPGTNERQLEKLRRELGEVFLAALVDPETVEILLNPDGTLWQERLGEKPVQIGSMTRTRAEAVLRTIAACVQTTITRESPPSNASSRWTDRVSPGRYRPWSLRQRSLCASAQAASLR